MTTEELNENRNNEFIKNPQGFISEWSQNKKQVQYNFSDDATFLPSWIFSRCVAAMVIYYKKQIAKLNKKIERKDKVIDAQIPCLRAVINENESLRNELLRQLELNLKEEDAEEYAKDFMSDEVTEIINRFVKNDGGQE